MNKNFDYRVAKLPLGVECSLYLLQGILRDEEFKINPKGSVSENDVVLMYSTAIIRSVYFLFFNSRHCSVMGCQTFEQLFATDQI